MPEAHVFLGAMVLTCALLVVLGFSGFLILLGVRTNGRAEPHGRPRPH
jgi:hypothetical protein